jgi:hypothetical protein
MKTCLWYKMHDYDIGCQMLSTIQLNYSAWMLFNAKMRNSHAMSWREEVALGEMMMMMSTLYKYYQRFRLSSTNKKLIVQKSQWYRTLNCFRTVVIKRTTFNI